MCGRGSASSRRLCGLASVRRVAVACAVRAAVRAAPRAHPRNGAFCFVWVSALIIPLCVCLIADCAVPRERSRAGSVVSSFFRCASPDGVRRVCARQPRPTRGPVHPTPAAALLAYNEEITYHHMLYSTSLSEPAKNPRARWASTSNMCEHPHAMQRTAWRRRSQHDAYSWLAL